ncbi:MAG: hypothetical protein GEU75_10760 [Dehalococcoidia bacterium]|nr:hypothetical protein [Dehalococcoidia bacterium]
MHIPSPVPKRMPTWLNNFGAALKQALLTPQRLPDDSDYGLDLLLGASLTDPDLARYLRDEGILPASRLEPDDRERWRS